jgi:hypothetical protein
MLMEAALANFRVKFWDVIQEIGENHEKNVQDNLCSGRDSNLRLPQ